MVGLGVSDRAEIRSVGRALDLLEILQRNAPAGMARSRRVSALRKRLLDHELRRLAVIAFGQSRGRQ